MNSNRISVQKFQFLKSAYFFVILISLLGASLALGSESLELNGDSNGESNGDLNGEFTGDLTGIFSGRFSSLNEVADFIKGGTYVPDTSQFPVQEKYFSNIGPQVRLTAFHVLLGLKYINCSEGSPASKGEPVLYYDGTIYLVAKDACQRLALPISDEKFKSHPEILPDSWGIAISPKKLNSEFFLSLDFTPATPGETWVIVSHGGQTDHGKWDYPPGFSSKAASFQVQVADLNGAWVQATHDGDTTRPGDSGAPWLRVHEDQTVSVVGTHMGSMADRTIPKDFCYSPGRCFSHSSSFVDLFSGEETKKRISDFAAKFNVEICGVNKICDPVKLPVQL